MIMQQMEANVTVNCVHPGIVRTRLTREREGFITGDTSSTFYVDITPILFIY